MSDAPGTIDYLDALFASIRAAAKDLSAMKISYARAKGTSAPTWRWQWIEAARVELARSRAHLVEAEARLGVMAEGGAPPAPLDQLPARLAALRTELVADEKRLAELVAESASRPLGQA